VRRLLAAPAVAAGPVVEAFAEGKLQVRLAALELLREWKAPADGLDPWRPETVTADRLKALRAWAAAAAKAAAAGPRPLSAEELAAARRELDRLAQATDAEAAAVGERLARHGPALLPEVY